MKRKKKPAAINFVVAKERPPESLNIDLQTQTLPC